MTTSTVTTITDELLAELEEECKSSVDIYLGRSLVRALLAERAELKRESRNRDMWKGQSERQAESLAEANQSYMAALHLLTSVRFASGDNGARMQNEFVEYIAELKRDAERYRWLRDQAMSTAGDCPIVMMLDDRLEPANGAKTSSALELEDLDAAIDAAMRDAK